MIYRSQLWSSGEIVWKGVEHDHRQISRIAGICWNRMTSEEREPYVEKARLAKEEHQRKYPNYKFCPVAKGKTGKRRSKEDVKARVSRSKVIAELLLEGHAGKNLSELADKMDDYGTMPLPTSRSESKHPKGTSKKKRNSKKPRIVAKQEDREPSLAALPPSNPRVSSAPPSPPTRTSSPPPLVSSSVASSSPPSSPELRELLPVMEESATDRAAIVETDDLPLDDPEEDQVTHSFVAYVSLSLIRLQGADFPFEYGGFHGEEASSNYEPGDLKLDSLYPFLMPISVFNPFPSSGAAELDLSSKHELESFGPDVSLDDPYSYFDFGGYSHASSSTLPQEEDFNVFLDSKSS
ncbi:hypothetical protein NM688_g2140 [Phlebia brevispora]|uniref:Uncharacterized protein n=1 Tax=Phlebia brevispora TaxID=194682 RepID=A0ACC1T9Q4_9APHY|nr:hypothetical protein NM688_g2140 [Phlebia brevispora]